MTIQEKLQALKEERDPSLKINRILADKAIAEAVVKMAGLEGVAGKDGYTPVKGKDYYTAEEIDKMVSYIESKIKVPKDGTNGADGKVGRNGESAIRGVDYWTPKDREEILKQTLSQIPKPKDGISPDIKAIVKQVTDGMPPVNFKDEVGKILASPGMRMLLHGGGISSVAHDATLAGSGTSVDPLRVISAGGVSSVTNSDGTLTISPTTGAVVASLSNTAVTPGIYTNTNLTIDAQGRITLATNGTGGSPAIGGPITGGTAGSVLFVNPSGTIAQDNANLFYDSTNHSLNIGTLSAVSSTARKVIELNAGGYGEPNAFNVASDGDKIILYRAAAAAYDGSIGVGSLSDMWFKSSGNAAGAGQFKWFTGIGTFVAMVLSGTGDLSVPASFTSTSVYTTTINASTINTNEITASGSGVFQATLNGAATGSYAGAYIRSVASSAVGYIGLSDSTAGNFFFRDALCVGTQNAFPFRINTNDTARVTVDATGNVGIGTITPGYKLDVSGDIGIGTLGKTLRIATGTNASKGTGTLVGGSVTINTNAVSSISDVFITDTGGGANIGSLYVSAVSANTSFTVSSTNGLDVSTFNWVLIKSY
jgi:hypothetical protein